MKTKKIIIWFLAIVSFFDVVLLSMSFAVESSLSVLIYVLMHLVLQIIVIISIKKEKM